MFARCRSILQQTLLVSLLALLALLVATCWQFTSPVPALRAVGGSSDTPRVLDRHGVPLQSHFSGGFNLNDRRPLHAMPLLLRTAFIQSEDKRFFAHHGVDWSARLQALRQNVGAGRKVRGASTITEQVVRILQPRPRTLWSRWLEGWEAIWLERYASKGEILEFYLNQVPYASQRRGVSQAARYYFNRDLTTLMPKEMLALAVLPRAPSAWDLYREPERAEPAIARLAATLVASGTVTAAIQDAMAQQKLQLQPSDDSVDATHFLRYVRTQRQQLQRNPELHSTLDAGLQRRVQAMLNTRLRRLQAKGAHNAAVLVADHRTGEILVWAVGGSGESADRATPAAQIDAVLAPRQPGSTLKPFLYAQALSEGWNASTLLDDAPLASAVGMGLHHFTNYSHSFYGAVSLREALGNSLNIPALHTVRFVGVKPFLTILHRLGISSLDRPEWVYDEGIALGNGEVSLLELTQAYAALANRGSTRSLHALTEAPGAPRSQQVFSPEVASLIGNILSDPWARRMEFGAGSILNLPVQTAAKTGTSSDYRDAWAMGYDARYVVGVWIGNLDRTPMNNVTGSTGPALVLRSIFAELNKDGGSMPLYLSAKLQRKEICLPAPGTKMSEINQRPCFPRLEYVLPQVSAKQTAPDTEALDAQGYRVLRPTQGLQLAYDPRIPADQQAFAFRIQGLQSSDMVQWRLNGNPIARAAAAEYLWPVNRGHWQLQASILREDKVIYESAPVDFLVK